MRKNVSVPSLPSWVSGKECVCQCRRCRRYGFDPWVGKIPSKRQLQPTPVFLSREVHGQRNLAGYSPWGCKKWTRLSDYIITVIIGEGA